MSGFDVIKRETNFDLGCATVFLNRPDKRNALSAELIKVLDGELDSLRDDAKVRSVFLRGNGKTFSAGADLDEIRAMQSATYEQNLAHATAFQQFFVKLANFPKPTAAIVHGPALAGGCGLATCCDFVIASSEATFGYPEVKIGFIPAIVMVLLTHQIGERAARDLCLSGATIDAATAHHLGLVTRVVDPAKLDEAALECARELSKNSPQAMAAVKAAFWPLHSMGVEQALKHAAELNAKARGTADCKEGIAAFLEKRKPKWVS